jgi:pimeloyl-ACP methyl ester carboxylesterase
MPEPAPPVEPETRRVAVGDVEVVYDEAGEGGRPLVLVHGFTGSRKDFASVIPDLAERGRVLAPSLRGHADGHHAGDAEGYGFDVLADEVAAWLDALGVERCDLLGHSMGGLLVQRVALEHPERVASLVLMDTAGRALDWMSLDLFELGARIAREQGMEKLHEILRGRAEDDPSRTEADRRLEREWGADRYWGWRRERFVGVDPHGFGPLARQLVEHPSLLARLADVRCPVLVMVGELDRPFLEPARELARSLPDARLVVLPRAGHQPQIEAPAEWLEALRGFLEEVRGA